MGKKILVVDDSALMRKLACDIINKDGRYDTPETCRNGEEALDKVKKNKYDAIVLDVYMPVMDGLEFLRQIKKEGLKERVMMFSTTTGEGTSQTIEALDLGAIDFIKKPDKYKDTSGEDFAKEFLRILEVVAQAGGHHLTVSHSAAHKERVAAKGAESVTLRPSVKISGEKIVAIASSTGGPKALHSVIPLLPKNLNAPVILVQHMPAGFTKSLAERLDSLGPISVKEAEEGDLLEKGTVYIAPGGKHMKVGKSGSHVRIYFGDEPHREGVKPCANYMYETLVDTDYAEVCCVVLTGMGMDGTEGIKNLEKRKKLHIISQDEATCAVYGMPKAIAQTGLVNEVLPLDKIAAAITKEIGTR
ncbi:MAG: chemotaxis response regulator protein-glutamate methylesterase [Lachnospiraceae bacterium]|nr:chemotaxis response regulator protein-glutamate methylesterase [Lachnospiraceae bacterium]MBQ9606302.1 chemotaxis response regulator protein-glutamate methylesterase [Lachnospiraceae bacterium]